MLNAAVRARFGTVDITPTSPGPLAANGLPDAVWTNVADRLEANVAVFNSKEGLTAIVTFDLLYVGADISDGIRRGMADVIPSERIWLSASHTHRAPATDRSRPALGIADVAYVNSVVDAVLQELRRLSASPSEFAYVTPVLKSSTLNHSVNRRRPGRLRLTGAGLAVGGVMFAPNPRGQKSEVARRIDWVDESGNTKAIFWHYACHPTSMPKPLAVSAGYPGAVRSQLRTRGDIPVLFFQGFSGDTRPDSHVKYNERPLARLVLGPNFRDFTDDEYADWVSSMSAAVLRAPVVESPGGPASVYCQRVCRPASELVIGGPIPHVIYQRIRVGAVDLVGVNAEPVVEYEGAYRQRAGDPNVWLVGCLDAAVGYVPTETQRKQGGYEVDGFCDRFGCDAVAPGAEAALLEGLTRL